MTAAVVASVVLVAAFARVACTGEPGFVDGAPRWSAGRMPLRACVLTYLARDEDDLPVSISDDFEAAASAVTAMNSRLGFDPYTLGGRDDCFVIVMIGAPVGSDWLDPGGTTVVIDSNGDGRTDGCSILTSGAVGGELLQLTIQHELGHCLGLAHDPSDRSIMRIAQTTTPLGEAPPTIMDSDRDLLREMYARPSEAFGRIARRPGARRR